MQKLVLMIAVVLAVAGAGTVILLSARADESRQAQIAVAQVQASFNDLQAAGVDDIVSSIGPDGNSITPSALRTYVSKSAQTLQPVRAGMSRLRRYPGVPGTVALRRAVAANVAAHQALYEYFARHPKLSLSLLALPARMVGMYATVTATASAASTSAGAVNAAYSQRAKAARLDEIVGATLAIAVLLGAFVFYFRRSRKLHEHVQSLLEDSRREATTDVLTGLRNRRALEQDLDGALEADSDEITVILYDLDGFKNYNDTFGHPAGDALLARLGGRLQTATGDIATAYRIGGDEFCLLARCTRSDGARLAQAGAETLSEDGEGFRITASFGEARLSLDAPDPAEALRLADQRLYRFKAQRRPSRAVEALAVLSTALTEHSSGLDRHTSDVADLSRETARALELSASEIEEIAIAAGLHDIGKLGIPASILDKSEPLTDEEWAFLRRHTLIGERIIAAAPSLATIAPLVRSSHERFDGRGYPDGLPANEIPLGARIIAVCDAWDAMTSERPYAAAITPDEAMAELGRCAGSQFDPAIVAAFATVVAGRAAGAH